MPTPIGDLTTFAATLPRTEALPPPPSPPPSVRTEATPGPVQADGPAPETFEFSDRLRELLGDANANQLEGQRVAEAYANGDRNDLHGTMIALEQADISFRFVSNVRTRLVEAYREVMRMGT
jgi:flagellar hook-basal body complex protein FliE